jgi:hypothetical protein
MKNDFAETLEGLNKTINRLRDEIRDLYNYKELAEKQMFDIADLHKRLDVKTKVFKVVVSKDNANYVLMITNILDTEQGVYIEGKL